MEFSKDQRYCEVQINMEPELYLCLDPGLFKVAAN